MLTTWFNSGGVFAAIRPTICWLYYFSQKRESVISNFSDFLNYKFKTDRSIFHW